MIILILKMTHGKYIYMFMIFLFYMVFIVQNSLCSIDQAFYEHNQKKHSPLGPIGFAIASQPVPSLNTRQGMYMKT